MVRKYYPILTAIFVSISFFALIFLGIRESQKSDEPIFSIELEESSLLFEYESTLGLGRNAIDLKVLQLSDIDFYYFKSPCSDFHTYPKTEVKQGDKWHVQTWHSTPIAESQSLFFASLLDNKMSKFIDNEMTKTLLHQLQYIRQTITQEGNYYAFYYKNQDNGLTKVELYVIDMKKKMIISLKKKIATP